jgi:Domain of unknown function (DUF1707)
VANRPGDGIVPLDYGAMRASTADRERAVDVLKAAFAEGRLDQGEYADRVGLAYSSRTYAELASLTADLPVGPLGTMPVMPIHPAYAQPGVTYVPVPVPVQPTPVAPAEPKTTGLAVAAFVFGLGSIVTAGVTAPIALILAIGAMIKVYGTNQKGNGLALAAIVVTALSLLLVHWG